MSNSSRPHSHKFTPSSGCFEQLEDRLLFDAAPDGGAQQPLDPALAPSTQPTGDQVSVNSATDLAQQPEQQSGHEIVFVDKSVTDYETLVAEIVKQTNAEVVFLNRNADGVEQIAAALEGRNDIRAIHIISHGEEGRLFLGDAVLDSESMQGRHQDELTVVRDALSEDEDLRGRAEGGSADVGWRRPAP